MTGDSIVDAVDMGKLEKGPRQEQIGSTMGTLGRDGTTTGSKKIHWAYMLISFVLLVILSALVFTMLIAAGILLIHTFGKIVDPLHIIIFCIFATIAFFISGMVFILGYFSSPFDISAMGHYKIDRELHEKMDKLAWSFAVYNNLAQDRRSRIAFCFTFLLPYMLLYGGFFLTIGFLTLGTFEPLSLVSLYIIIAIGMIIWFGMALIGFIVGNKLMKKFVRDGTIKGIQPFPSPKDYQL